MGVQEEVKTCNVLASWLRGYSNKGAPPVRTLAYVILDPFEFILFDFFFLLTVLEFGGGASTTAESKRSDNCAAW